MSDEPDVKIPGQASGVPGQDGMPLADRGWYLAIEFQQSSSARFDLAAKAASKHPGFALLLDESGACVYRVLARADQLKSLGRILGYVRGWKSTRYYVCGSETTAESIESWLSCYLQRCQEGLPNCRRRPEWANPAQPVGCPWAGISLMPSEWDAWYRRGEFDHDGVFHVNKDSLLLRLGSWRRTYGDCPFADAELLRRVVDLLPDAIDPRADRRWRVARSYYSESLLNLTPASPASYGAFLREHLAGVFR